MNRILIALCMMAGFSVPLAAQEAPPPAVVVAPATLSDINDSATFNGRLEADQRVDLRARVSGTLMEIGFEPGDVVDEGDVLFKIEDALYSAAVQEAEGALQSAQAQQQLAELERDRQQELVSRGTVSQSVADQAEAAFGNAQGATIRAQAALDRARLNLSYTNVVAPFAGRIGVANVDVGALVGPEAGALATLIQLDPIHAEFSMPTSDLRTHLDRVAEGTASNNASASLILANGTTYTQQGDLDFIDSAVEGGTDSVTIRAEFANPDGALFDGELVRIVLTSDEARKALTIPQRAVQRDLEGAFVMLVTADNVVEQRRIEVSDTIGSMTIVTNGLEEGDQVIVDGVNKVRPGVTVDAAPTADG